MNGELAQVAALVADGNVALAGAADLSDFEASNSTFSFVRDVTFDVRRLLQSGEVHSVVDWVNWLASAGHNRLSMTTGGSRWGLAAHTRRTGRAWKATWQTTSDPRPRVWSVNYQFAESGRAVKRPTVDLRSTEQRLQRAVRAARDLAREDEGLKNFADLFDEALVMASDPPASLPRTDLLPDAGYHPAARRLLTVAAQAWVFGGMGSWNDVALGEPERMREYGRVTTALYAAVLDGVRDAVNSFGQV